MQKLKKNILKILTLSLKSADTNFGESNFFNIP